MSTLMKLLDALYAERDDAIAHDRYVEALAYDITVDLADGLSKGVSARVWLPRYIKLMTETADKIAEAGDTREVPAYQTSALYATLLLEEIKA